MRQPSSQRRPGRVGGRTTGTSSRRTSPAASGPVAGSQGATATEAVNVLRLPLYSPTITAPYQHPRPPPPPPPPPPAPRPHTRLMFQQRDARRPTPAGLASYDRLRRMLAAIAAAGRLRVPVEEATRACWCAAHGVTSLLAGGYFSAQDSAVALLRDGLIAQLTTAPAGPRARRPRGQKGNRPWHVANRS